MDKTIRLTILLSVILYLYSNTDDEMFKKKSFIVLSCLRYYFMYLILQYSLEVTINFDLYK